MDKYFYINSFLNENEKCEVIVSFIKNEKNMFKSYCNTIETPDGGSHEIAIKNGMTNTNHKISNIQILWQRRKCAKIEQRWRKRFLTSLLGQGSINRDKYRSRELQRGWDNWRKGHLRRRYSQSKSNNIN